MNSYVYSSSRGRCLTEMECAGVYVKPGGKLLELYNVAKNYLQNCEGTRIVYFVCGIPDICTLFREKRLCYEESCLQLSEVINEDSVVNDFIQKLHEVDNGLKSIGCKTVFCTICTMNFDNWNHHRLSARGTSYLKFESEYSMMQDSLNSILNRLNQFITELNISNGVCTPFLHSYVHQRCNGKVRYKYGKLIDGLHPSVELGRQWATHLHKVINDNELKFAQLNLDK